MSEDASRRDATVTAAVSMGSAEEPRPEAPQLAPLRVRDRERYELRGEQGRGGLGLVSRAHDRELGRDVAVKELLQRGSMAELRFLREALITSRLEHPGIVPVHEAGRWSDGTPFYTMKLVGGRSLQALLSAASCFEERLAFLPNLIAVADAIAYAHDRGVIHRDLKPANVMVGDFGETIVIDWGLAKVVDETEDQVDENGPYRSSARDELTAAGSVLGTPAYMAPEQLGGRADHRADIYALGGILHHLLTGQPPHGRGGEAEVAEPVFEYPRKAPADLIAVARRALAHGRNDRYQTTRAFADDLKAYTRRDRVAARRYSLPARLALAFARHRAISMVAIAALVVLSITLGISLVNIRAERAQALAARETAVVNGAAAMMQRDPTRAWAALLTIPVASAPALLRARVRAAGVADLTVALPGRFDDMQVMKGGTRVVLSTGERTLHVLDTRTGKLRRLAEGLTEPVVWAATEDRVYFVHGSAHLAVAEVSIDGGPATEVAPLTTLPRYMFASDHGAYWMATDATLHLAARGSAPAIVARDVEAFMVAGAELVLCTKSNQLMAGPRADALRPLGVCEPKGAWAKLDGGFAYASASTLYVSFGGQLRTSPLPADDAIRSMQLTSSGIVVGISRSGEPLLRHAGTEAFEHVRLAGTPDELSSHGNLVAWRFADGSVEIIDVTDGRHWSLQTTPGASWCFTFLSDRRLMSCDRNEVRLWTLTPSAPQIVANNRSSSNNVVFDAHAALFDAADGGAYVISRGDTQARLVHKHEAFSYGVAWCSGEACSAGWDGRVMCTNLASNTSRTAVDARSVTPWLAAGGNQCFTAAASGGVIDLRTPDRPAYSHRHEPYRLAVSPDGRYVASGDWGGDLIVFDVTRREVVATRANAHAGRVTNVAWTDGALVTSGADGILRLWSATLEERKSWRMRTAIRYLDAAKQTIGATLDDGSVWLLSTRGGAPQHVELGGVVSAVAASPDGAAFAVGTNDGDVVVLAADGRAAATRFGRNRISCLGFEDAQTFLACTSSGRIMRVPLAALAFQSNAGGKR